MIYFLSNEKYQVPPSKKSTKKSHGFSAIFRFNCSFLIVQFPQKIVSNMNFKKSIQSKLLNFFPGIEKTRYLSNKNH